MSTAARTSRCVDSATSARRGAAHRRGMAVGLQRGAPTYEPRRAEPGRVRGNQHWAGGDERPGRLQRATGGTPLPSRPSRGRKGTDLTYARPENGEQVKPDRAAPRLGVPLHSRARALGRTLRCDGREIAQLCPHCLRRTGLARHRSDQQAHGHHPLRHLARPHRTGATSNKVYISASWLGDISS